MYNSDQIISQLFNLDVLFLIYRDLKDDPLRYHGEADFNTLSQFVSDNSRVLVGKYFSFYLNCLFILVLLYNVIHTRNIFYAK